MVSCTLSWGPSSLVWTGNHVGAVLQPSLLPVLIPFCTYLPFCQTVTFNVTLQQLQVTDPGTGNRCLSPGTYKILLTNGVDKEFFFPVSLRGPHLVTEPFPGQEMYEIGS